MSLLIFIAFADKSFPADFFKKGENKEVGRRGQKVGSGDEKAEAQVGAKGKRGRPRAADMTLHPAAHHTLRATHRLADLY